VGTIIDTDTKKLLREFVTGFLSPDTFITVLDKSFTFAPPRIPLGEPTDISCKRNKLSICMDLLCPKSSQLPTLDGVVRKMA
jgi:hypothetical protein